MTTKREITWATVLSCAAGICVSGSALAVVKNYNAPLIGNISAGGNWTPAGAPAITDNWIFPIAAAYTVTFDPPAADGSIELAFNAPATVTVFNTGGPHVTPLMRVGGVAASATVSVNSGSFQPDELLVASLQAGVVGNLSFRNAGTILRMQDNGLVRIGDNIACDGTLGLFNGALMTDETNPPGVPTDTGRIVLGADGKLIVNDADLTLDEWDLDMTAGGSVTLSNNAVVEVGDLDMGATSVIRGAGTMYWVT
ncbi:MAG TPA: hypothetical protein VK157_12725, partial [Phycisphaerales bacterium]|nr:hypothetical protein [Phycisphaerales bacterium]